MTTHQQNTGKPNQNVLNDDLFDVAIVGAGVVGCAIARRFVLEGARICVIEKATDILDGSSKANSAILHTGFDAPPGSLELSCIQHGYREYNKIHEEMGLPLDNNSAHVVAWNDKEAALLASIVARAHANGISDVHLIDTKQLYRAEPHLAKQAKAAIAVPGESIIDPWSAPYAYLRQALINGGQAYLSCAVTAGEFNGIQWRLQTSRGILKTRHVINCAGLYGDELDNGLLGNSNFRITPRKGQFVVFDKAASSLVNSIILPVPTAKTKGVVVCRTIFGNVLVGPTAEDQESRSDASTDKAALEMLIASGVKKFPALENMPVTAVYAGLRPATEFKDYQIEAKPDQNWITVGGIRSTGLSGALGIGRYVYNLYSDFGKTHTPIARPQLPAANILAENSQRDWQNPDHGKIVCHCELVTEREVIRALSGPLSAQSMAGLKRQTRATMGRCQGFHCAGRLAEMTRNHFSSAFSEVVAVGQ